MKKTPLCQRIDRQRVAQVVHRFYRRVLAEPGLAPYFAHIDDWPQHESYITDFWWGVMGGAVASPRPRAMERGHRDLDFGRHEMSLWLALFQRTLEEELPQELAAEWTTLAKQLGRAMARGGMLRSEAPSG